MILTVNHREWQCLNCGKQSWGTLTSERGAVGVEEGGVRV